MCSTHAIHTHTLYGAINIYAGLPAPSGVIVDGVDDTSVRVSWRTVDGADRYTVTFAKTMEDGQPGLCRMATHTTNITVDAPNTNVSIDVGQAVDNDATTILRAYTTYTITVVAESNVTSSREISIPITVTTNQTSK